MKRNKLYLFKALVAMTFLLVVSPLAAQHHEMRRQGGVVAHSLRYDPERPTEQMPEALQELLRAYRTQKRYANRSIGRAVAPLLQSVRSQGIPYNLACPYYEYSDGTVSSSRCLTGCVATSIEQVVTYWHHPIVLKDTLHGWETDHYTIPDVMPGTPIDWNNVLYRYDGAYTEQQALAVANLTYYCGVAAHMQWTPTSSGTSLYRAFEPLWKAFDFQTIAFVERGLYTPQAWNRMLRNELENGRPICYTGHNMALSGHAFNIDGVDEQGYYHINWGYGGDYDGYYDLDFLNPFESVSDASQEGQMEGFFSNQTALFMHPDDFVINIYDTVPVNHALYGVSVDSVTFRRQPDTQAYTIADFYFRNNTNDSLTYTFEVITYLPTDTALWEDADYVALSSVTLAPYEEKSWPVYCQFMESGERILAISSTGDSIAWEMPIIIGEGAEPNLTFSSLGHTITKYGENLTATFHTQISNTASAGCAGNLVTFCLQASDEPTDQRHWHVLALPAGETETIEATFQSLRPGVHYKLLVRCPWNVVSTDELTPTMEEASDDISGLHAEICDGPLWDLCGRRVNTKTKGIVIRHGKKIFIQ